MKSCFTRFPLLAIFGVSVFAETPEAAHITLPYAEQFDIAESFGACE